MKRLILFFTLSFIWSTSSLSANRITEKTPPVPPEISPWFTGPILTPSGNNVEKGRIDFEPFVFATYSNGNYNSSWEKENAPWIWNINILPMLQFGLTDWLDLTIIPSWFFNKTQKAFQFSFGDVVTSFGIQLLTETDTSWYPSIRLGLSESFPTGQFDQLDPEQDGTDVSGNASYVTGAFIAFSKLIHLWGIHWTNVRFSCLYTVPASARVRGFTDLGGSYDTDGVIYPGQTLEVFFAFEFNFTQNWNLSMDALASYSKRVRFKGNPGTLEATGLPADLTQGSSTQYSLAPSLEYSWSDQLGLITGAWFTVAGRNAQSFVSWVGAVNYYY